MSTSRHETRNPILPRFPYIVLLTGLGLTIFAAYFAARSIQLQTQSQFDRSSQHLRASLHTRVETYLALLRSSAGFFAGSEEINPTEFEAYVQRLNLPTNYPGIQGIGYVPRVLGSEKGTFIEGARERGSSNFHIWPESDNSESYPILYFAPADPRNLVALGYDMLSDPVRREAMEKARDTGLDAASGKVTSVQEIGGTTQTGFLIYDPIFEGGRIPETTEERRAQLRGFVYTPFRMRDLLSSVLEEESLRFPDLEIYDSAEMKPADLLYRAVSYPAASGNLRHRFASVFPVRIAGRTWTVRFSDQTNLKGPWWIPPILLGAGTFLSLALFYLTIAEARARNLAESSASRLQKSEHALRESETRLRLMLESAQDYAIYTTDLDGRITAWNTGAERIFGFRESEVLGQSNGLIFTVEDRQSGCPRMELDQAIKDGLSRDERWHIRKDESRLFVSGIVRPMTDASGKKVGFIKIARDVTERLQAEEKLRREQLYSETIINSLPGVFYLFGDGTCLRWNENTELVTGYSKEEIAARGPLDFFAGPDRKKVADAIQRVMDTGQATVEAHFFTRDGRSIPYLFSGRRIELDGRLCVMGMGVDITERHRAEREARDAEERLRQYTAELELRVAERTAHLQQSLQSLEGVLYHVAHDLRAPLRAMASFTSILLEDYSDHFDEAGRDYAQRISTSANRMDKLVHDLLAYGRLAHATVPLHSVNLETEVNTVLGQFANELEMRHAQVVIEHPLPPVMANPSVLEQVLASLISNALKFTRPGVPPRIKIWSENRADLRLWIQDNGIGIKPEYQGRIFRVFERLHSSELYPGTGIGLAIVKKGMERLSGRVGVESIPGEGSRFWLELPTSGVHDRFLAPLL